MSPEDDLTMMGDYKTMQAISILVDGGVCFVRRRSTSPTLLDLGPVYIPPAGQQVDKTQSDLGSSPVVTTILLTPRQLRHLLPSCD
jgi:hypothetical protein